MVVEPFEVYHLSPGVDEPETADYRYTEELFTRKWGHRLSPPTLAERHPHIANLDRRWRRLRLAVTPATDEVALMAKNASHLAIRRVAPAGPDRPLLSRPSSPRPTGRGVAPLSHPPAVWFAVRQRRS